MAWRNAITAVLRRTFFPAAVAFIFLRFSFLHELLMTHLGLNLYLLLLIGVPVVFAAILSGGFQRTLHSPAAKCWVLFLLWMVVDIPFSEWKSDSLSSVFQYTRVNLAMLLVVAGFAVTLRDCYWFMTAIALGGVVNILDAAEFSDTSRLAGVFGSIANSNDYAAHLLLVLPFLLWLSISSRQKLWRFGALAFLLAGIFVGARTGSRGALIGVACMAVFLLFRSRGTVRILSLVVLPVLAVALTVFLPQNLRTRYLTLFGNDAPAVATQDADAAPSEAEESSRTRRYLLTTSLDLAFHHPLFGVGPNEFAITEGALAKSEGRHGAWQQTHNTYTQVASEDGVPALIFFLGAIVLTFRSFNRVYKKCAPRPDLRRMQVGALCMMLSMIGFSVAIFFLSLAYSMYLPVMTGLAISLERAVDHELESSPATV